VPANNPTFIEEALNALRGAVAVAIGSRDAPSYFDFGQRGLAGSFIALLLALALGALAPDTGADGPPLVTAVLASALLYAGMMGGAYLVLYQFQRLDGFVPYLVVYNWLNLVLGLIFSLLVRAGIVGAETILFAGLVMLVLQINVARLVVTLRPLQIAAFLGAQLLVGIIVAAPFIAAFPTPEAVAA
jgi:hypothetical protein